MFKLFVVAFIAIGISLGAHASCCEDQLNCWETCMIPPAGSSRSLQKAYTGIHQMIRGIKAIYAPCNEPHGTAYMMDGAVPFAGSNQKTTKLYAYQRHLASIVAITQSVSNTCNQFCTSKFFKNYAFYIHSWTCKNRCEAARVLNSPSFRFFTTDASPSWVGGGQILSKLCFDRPRLRHHTCMRNSSNELLLSITNSRIWWNSANLKYCKDRFHCATIGTNPASVHSNMASWAHSGSVYQLPANADHVNAAKKILRCMNANCCPSSFAKSFPLRDAEEMEGDLENRQEHAAQERMTFEYICNGSATTNKFSGTLAEFQRSQQCGADPVTARAPASK